MNVNGNGKPDIILGEEVLDFEKRAGWGTSAMAGKGIFTCIFENRFEKIGRLETR